MKKVLIVLAVLCMVAFPVMAASKTVGVASKNTVGVGLNLGNNTGVGLRFGMGDFDVLANVGFDLISCEALAGDASVSYRVFTIDGGRKAQFPITVGVGASAAIHFDPVALDLDILVPVGIEYDFSQLNKDAHITMYFRVAPGMQLLEGTEFKPNFAIAGYLGALWNF